MEINEEYKSRLQGQIVETMLMSLGNETLTEEEMPDIADFVLTEVAKLGTHEDVMDFLRDLSAKWRIFSSILVLESGEVKERVEDEVAGGVLTLAQHGKIEEAIKLAQSMTEHSVQTQ